MNKEKGDITKLTRKMVCVIKYDKDIITNENMLYDNNR